MIKEIGVITCFIVLVITSSFWLPAKAAEVRMKQVYVGGVNGVEGLADGVTSKALRESGNVGLYIHDYIWKRIPPILRMRILQTFKQTGDVFFEGNESSHGVEYWEQVISIVGSAHINAASINTKTSTSSALTTDQWKNFVNAARKREISYVSVIFTPNDESWKKYPFSDGRWEIIREWAQYGGGITLDSPPWYYLSHPAKYREFIVNEILWARDHKLLATLIISPPRSNDGDFLEQTKSMIEDLRSMDALPTCFIVENYMSNPPKDFKFVIGDESSPETVLGVARWLESYLARLRTN